jgi:hypothetical protein
MKLNLDAGFDESPKMKWNSKKLSSPMEPPLELPSCPEN